PPAPDALHRLEAVQRRGDPEQRDVAVLGREEVEKAATQHLLLGPADRALEALVDRVARHGCRVVDHDEKVRARVRDRPEEFAVAFEFSTLVLERRPGPGHESIMLPPIPEAV